MGINFNIVKKPTKKEVEEEVDEIAEDEEIEDELEEDDQPSKPAFDPKKRMIKFMGIIVVVVVVIILILSFATSLGGNKSHKEYKYSEIEKILVKAAKSYFKDHSEYLPKEDGDIVEVDYTNLVAEGKMKDLSEYTNEKCSATVKVEKEENDNNYIPNLNCGTSYSSVPLYEKIMKDNETVNSGYGLYSNKGSYIFRGEELDNYVSIGDILWRIVKITSDNNVVLISEEGIGYSKPWDDRYNQETTYETGNTVYASSRVKEYLDKVYKATSKDDDYYITKKVKNNIVSYNICTGKRTIDSESKDNSLECQETLKNQKLGLLTLSEYMIASVDANCKKPSDRACKNYNYLATTKDEWWTATASNKASQVFMINRSGIVKEENASNYAAVRPVIYLDSNVIYKSGKGTLKSPYKIR